MPGLCYAMASEADEPDTELSPDDAFAVLGNETRMEILQTLGEADDPLSFSELRDQVGVSDSGRFNYHLDQLAGHFVQHSADGYELNEPGSRVVQAVLSGAVTDVPVTAPAELDEDCYYCGGRTVHKYHKGHVGIFCIECGGNYRFETPSADEYAYAADLPDEWGFLGGYSIPPAGVHRRSSQEALRAATTHGHLEVLSSAVGVCPRCSARIEESVDVCEPHDAGDGVCGECDYRHAVHHIHRCTNCNYARMGFFSRHLLVNRHLLHFISGHGLNPIAPESPMTFWAHLARYDEEVISADPFEAEFTFTIDGDTITLTVDDDLNVVEVTSGTA